MTLTVKLKPEIERQLEMHCRMARTTKSEVVSRLLRDFLRSHSNQSPYELAERMGLIGIQKSAPAAARDHSRYLKGKLRARRAR